MTPLMRLLTLVVGELVMLSLMLGVIFLGFVVAGTLSFLTFIGSSLPFLGLWSIIKVGMVLLPILWFGLLVPSPRGVGWFMLLEIWHFCPGRLLFGSLSGLVCLLLLSVADGIVHWPYTTGLLV